MSDGRTLATWLLVLCGACAAEDAGEAARDGTALDASVETSEGDQDGDAAPIADATEDAVDPSADGSDIDLTDACAPVPFSAWTQLGACPFYRCADSHVGCGEDGYLLAFACKYADRYLVEVYPEMTAAGQAFLESVFECLQRSIAAEDLATHTCASIEELGFGSHVPCYLAAGFCDLPGADIALVLDAIDADDMQHPLQQAASRAVAEECF